MIHHAIGSSRSPPNEDHTTKAATGLEGSPPPISFFLSFRRPKGLQSSSPPHRFQGPPV